MLKPYRARIEPEWIDYNGHLRDAYYGLVLSYATDDLMDQVGLDAAYRASTRCTLYTLEVHIHYLHEVKSTDGSKFHGALRAEPVAVAESMLLHVRQAEQVASASFPVAIAELLAALKLDAEARAQFGPSSRKLELQRR